MVVRIALSGKLRSGKTTTRELFEQIAKEYFNMEFVNLPLATPIYTEAYSFYERHGLVWTTKDRKLLEGIGEALNDKYPHGDKIVELYKEELEKRPSSNVIADDMRRITQAEFLKGQGFKLIRLHCPDEVRRERCLPGEWSEGAITDIELDNYDGFDFTIINNYPSTEVGLEKLKGHVKQVLGSIVNGI